MTPAEVFERIYREKAWGDGSGGGSAPDASAPYVAAVNQLIAERRPERVVDVGCGDGWVASRFDLRSASYVGTDVSPSIIDYCRRTHTDPHRSFHLNEPPFVPGGTALVLVKEVTQHLDEFNLMNLLMNLRFFNYPIVHCSATNPGGNGELGGYRPVRLSRPPWNLPTVPLVEWEWGGTGYQAELWEPGK